MERKERVKAAVKGEWVDHVPCGFFLHFPKTTDSFDKTVKAHLDFFEATDTDIAKIMNENLVTSEDLICTSEDFDKIPEITMDTPYMAEQVRLVREIVKERAVFPGDAPWNLCFLCSSAGAEGGGIHGGQKTGAPVPANQSGSCSACL